MTLSYNLIDQPWVACITTEGQYIELGLRDVLVQAHHIRTVVGQTPIESVAIYPLALAILYRAFPHLNGQKDWKAMWHRGAFDAEAVEGYLSAWYARFDLFAEQHPFYQSEDERVKPKSILYLADAIGGTGTLFIHKDEQQQPIWSCAKTATALLVAQQFRLGGGISGKETDNFRDSPYARGILFWAQGITLFETLMLNLIPLNSVKAFAVSAEDRPAWEMDDPFDPPRGIPLGYLDYLTWQNNRIKLYRSSDESGVMECRIAPSKYLDEAVVSPQKRYVKSEKKDKEDKTIPFSFMYFNENRALWREYHSLLQLDNYHVTRPPAVVDWVARVHDGHPPTLLAVGQLADQAKPIFYRQEALPLPNALLSNEQSVMVIANAMTLANEVREKVLYSGLKKFAEGILKRGGEGKPDPANVTSLMTHWNIEAVYWERLEPHFWELVTMLGEGDGNNAIESWKAILQTVVNETFAMACQIAGKDLVVWRAEVEATRLLRAQLNKVLNSEG